jgi:hypothetical protein
MLLYDNGPINGTVDAFTINFGYQVSNSFTLAQASQLTGVQFGTWQLPGDKTTAVDWTISTGPTGGGVGDGSQPSGIIASGTASTTDTLFSSSNPYEYQLDEITFPLSLTLAPGTYYLSLQNGVVNTGDPVYWDANNGPSTAYENYIGLLNGNSEDPGGSESFQIYGTPATVPEPTSLVVFGLTTLSGMGYCGWLQCAPEAGPVT